MAGQTFGDHEKQQDRSGQQRDRSGWQQDRSGRQQDRSDREQLARGCTAKARKDVDKEVSSSFSFAYSTIGDDDTPERADPGASAA